MSLLKVVLHAAVWGERPSSWPDSANAHWPSAYATAHCRGFLLTKAAVRQPRGNP